MKCMGDLFLHLPVTPVDLLVVAIPFDASTTYKGPSRFLWRPSSPIYETTAV